MLNLRLSLLVIAVYFAYLFLSFLQAHLLDQTAPGAKVAAGYLAKRWADTTTSSTVGPPSSTTISTNSTSRTTSTSSIPTSRTTSTSSVPTSRTTSTSSVPTSSIPTSRTTSTSSIPTSHSSSTTPTSHSSSTTRTTSHTSSTSSHYAPSNFGSLLLQTGVIVLNRTLIQTEVLLPPQRLHCNMLGLTEQKQDEELTTEEDIRVLQEEISVTQPMLKICFTRSSQSEHGPKFYE
ncbi:hypothetical protein BGW80DRAFT_1460761 [Lactifluus volemus]|nr:hypothetical protein BGW80DRAFT_1460761 [Lactifluus volemus]